MGIRMAAFARVALFGLPAGAAILALAAGSVSANIVPEPPHDVSFRLSGPASGIAVLFVLNFLLNLSLVTSGLFISTRAFRGGFASPSKSGLSFMLAVLAAVAVITWVGAFVDYYLVTQAMYIEGSDFGVPYDGTYHLVSFGFLRWLSALVMIFLSVGLSLTVFLRLGRGPSWLIATFVTAVNPFWWVLISELGEKATFATLIVGVIVAPVMLRWALIWRGETTAVLGSAVEGARTS